MIIGIVAVAENGVIGNQNGIPWKYKSDMKHFRETTTGHTIVMGRKTFQSIGRPLPHRSNAVLTKSIIMMEGIWTIRNISSILDREHIMKTSYPNIKHETYIIGGSEVYHSFKEHIDKWIITEIPESPIGDTFFDYSLLDDFVIEDERELEDGLIVKTYVRKPELQL